MTAAHSAVVSDNALEHIRDDVAAIGHERRCTRASLEAALRVHDRVVVPVSRWTERRSARPSASR